MKTLSIKQPWASLIAHGIKDIENRTWSTNYRGRIYIHASASQPKGFSSILGNERFNAFHDHEQSACFAMQLALGHRWASGAIIGEVDIVDCVLNHDSIWADHRAQVLRKINGKHCLLNVPVYNWVLANPIRYEQPFLNVKGALSLWEWKKPYNVVGSAELVSNPFAAQPLSAKEQEWLDIFNSQDAF